MDFSLLKKNKTQVWYVVLGIGAVVLMLLLFPQIKNFMKLSKEVSEKKKTLKDIEKNAANFTALEKELSSLAAAHEKFLSRLPNQKEFSVFLELISELAKKNDVKIIAVEPQKVIDDLKSYYVQIPVFIDANCGYHELGKFVNDLEFAEKFMKIEDLKIKSDNENPQRHSVLITVNAFCLKEKENEIVRR